MVVIDTSAWVESLRTGGRADVRARVEAYLVSGLARLCPPVILELINGALGNREKKIIKEMVQTVQVLIPENSTWQRAYRYAENLRARGVTIPQVDIMIKAIADEAGAEILTLDGHFESMAFLKN